MGVYLRRKSWYIDFTFKGERIWKTPALAFEVGTKWGLERLRQEKRVCSLNLSLPANPLFSWCLGPELNRHGGGPPRDFKSLASTNSATQASLNTRSSCLHAEVSAFRLPARSPAMRGGGRARRRESQAIIRFDYKYSL